MKLRADTESVKPPHVTMRTDYVRETGLFYNPGCIQVNDARVNDLCDCTPILKRGKSGLTCDNRPKATLIALA